MEIGGAHRVEVRLLAQALCFAVVSASVAPWLGAQDSSTAGITAPVPLTRPPVAPSQTATSTGKPVRIVICQPGGRTNHPALWVLDGVKLGLRPDGTVDHEAAQRALSKLDPNRIESIQVLKGEAAIARFGPGAHQGAVLFVTRPPDSSRIAPPTAKGASP
jgi:hypothetical protein